MVNIKLVKAKINLFDETLRTGFDEHEIESELRQISPTDEEFKNIDIISEYLAFGFIESINPKESIWGTFYGPMMTWQNQDGTYTESPSIRLVTNEIIRYWEKRAEETTNPVLKGRYSGLVWDFERKVSGTNPPISMCHLNIISFIHIANGQYYRHAFQAFNKLKRALALSKSISSQSHIEQVKCELIRFAKEHSDANRLGFYGDLFDLLIDQKHIIITNQEETLIINALEEKMKTLSMNDLSKIDPWGTKQSAIRLAAYYKKLGKLEDVKRVILKVKDAFYYVIESSSPLQAQGWLEDLHKLLTINNLKNEAEEVLLRIRDVSQKARAQMGMVSSQVQIPKKEIDKYVDAFTSGTPEEIMALIAIKHIPTIDEVKSDIYRLKDEFPFQFLFTQKISDENGRVVASIGSLENDFTGQLMRQISFNLTFSSILLRFIFEKIVDNKILNIQDIISHVIKSHLVNENRAPILERALDAYFQKDFLITVHLLIPLIEDIFRNILEVAGGNVLVPKTDSYLLKSFHEVLSDLKGILGEDFVTYLQVLYTDPRGWNMRNKVCHGICELNNFDAKTADRLIHTLFCIGLLQKN